ncbi:MAG: tryptophan 7-halogenase [Pseudonocardiaceae bacterium]
MQEGSYDYHDGDIKEKFPRYQIGESLLPSTVHAIARLLGIDNRLRAAGFMVKNGGTFRWGTNPAPWTFSFAISPRFAWRIIFEHRPKRTWMSYRRATLTAAGGCRPRGKIRE